MDKFSNIISSPTISLYEGELIGTIYNITIDCYTKKCKYAHILSEDDNIPKIIKFSEIYKFGKDCVFVKNKHSIELSDNYPCELSKTINPINLEVYSLEGSYIGKVTDIIINKNYTIDKILINNSTTIDNKNIFNIGKSVILIDNKKTSISKFKPTQKIINNTKEQNKVVILNTTTKENPKNIDNYKIITDSKFLIDRIITTDIIAQNGEIIAKSGSKITKDIIHKSSYYGKLLDISRFSQKA